MTIYAANLNDTATPLGSLVRSLGSIVLAGAKRPCDDKLRLHRPGVALTRKKETQRFLPPF